MQQKLYGEYGSPRLNHYLSSMCDDLDLTLSLISTKINRIFCDREFVGYVQEDLDIILKNENHCVLFPKLKPIFLKVLRCQAVISDLNLFCVKSGSNQVIIVGKKLPSKSHIDDHFPEAIQVPKTMGIEDKSLNSIKKIRTRPTQSYYIPPAQRTISKRKTDEETSKTSRKSQTSKHKDLKKCHVLPMLESADVIQKGKSQKPLNIESTDIIRKEDENSSQTVPIVSSCSSVKNEISECDPYMSAFSGHLGPLLMPDDLSIQNNLPTNELPKLLDNVNLDETQNIYITEEHNDDQSILNCTSDISRTSDSSPICDTKSESSIFNFSCLNSEEHVSNLNKEVSSVLQSNIKLSIDDLHAIAESILNECSVKQNFSESLPRREIINKIIEVLETMINEEENELENRAIFMKDIKDTFKQKILTQFCNSNFSNALIKEECDQEDITLNLLEGLVLSDSEHEVQSSQVPGPQVEELHEETQYTNIPSLLICYNNIDQYKPDSDIDNENKEMQRALVNINRKRRRLKQISDDDNTLQINETKVVSSQIGVVAEKHRNIDNKTEQECTNGDNDKVANWEDMFDENGDLHLEYVDEIVKQIGYEVKIVKATHDYSDYQNTKYKDLEHVIELYDFPSTFKTQDIMQLYRNASQDVMYVKWCDDTHCLLVLSSPAQAQRALQIEQTIIKSRPLSHASKVATKTAENSDLKPAMKRPQTNMQTARRLINTYLGTKSNLSKEEIERERQALRDAREQRRLARQNEKDAWEGRPRNIKS